MHARQATNQVRTLDGFRPADQVVYIAGSNLPGCMPESDSIAFRFVDDALDFLVGEVRDHVNAIGEWSALSDVALVESMVADRDAHYRVEREGVLDVLVGADHGFGGRVFFVHARAVDIVGPADD